MKYWPYAALAGAFLFVNWPILGKPFFIDNIAPAYCWSTGGAGRWACLWQRCTLPHYFRPLAAPLFWTLFALWGARAFFFRLLMLAVQAATAGCLWGLTRRLSGRHLPGAAAALVYLFSVSHWVELLGTAALPHCVSNLFFWLAVWFCVFGEGAGGAVAGFSLAAVGLFFKEHLVVVAGFAWLVRRAAFGRGRWWTPRETGLALLSGSYVLARLFLLRSSFADPANYWRFGPPRAFSDLHLGGVLYVFLEPMLYPLSYRYSLHNVVHWLHASPAAAGLWLLGALAAATAAFAALGRFEAEGEAARTPWRAAAWICLGGAALGLLPYAFFKDSLSPDNALHYCLALGACSMAFGLAAAGWSGGPRGLALKLALAGLVLRSALVFRFPPAAMPGYRLAAPLEETARTLEFLEQEVGPVKDGAKVAFEGFPPVLEIPALFSALHPGAEAVAAGARCDWRIARRQDPNDAVCWTAIPEAGPARAACWAGPYAFQTGLSRPGEPFH